MNNHLLVNKTEYTDQKNFHPNLNYFKMVSKLLIRILFYARNQMQLLKMIRGKSRTKSGNKV